MKHPFARHQALVVLFWILACATVPLLAYIQIPPPGWDLNVYSDAIHSLRAGHDPYADGIARQIAFHAQASLHPEVQPPITYVYSPITLPLIGAIGLLPLRLSGALFWFVFAVGLLATVWVGTQFAETKERWVFTLLAPAAVFFPGLLQNKIFLSGNVVYILYGAVFTTALLGWRRGQWTWFYVATLAASCFKIPLLSLLLIPALTARPQWRFVCIAGSAGIALFALQPLVWHSAFRHYLVAVALQFSYNHDFGLSPAGLLGNLLFYYGLPYSFASTACYLVYGVAVILTLIYLARMFFAGRFSLERWVPVMLVGVILLNPRIKEYDVAPLSIPMALIVWRLFARGNTFRRTVLAMSLFLLVVNAIANSSFVLWKPVESLLLVSLFVCGAWDLLRGTPDLLQGPTSSS